MISGEAMTTCLPVEISFSVLPSTELWVLEHPQAIQKLQMEYAEAGSQIIYAPTCRGVPFVRKNMDGGSFTQVNDRVVELDFAPDK